MKKILISSLIIATTSFAENFEYPYLYKDPKAMGMGGAYTAVGGTSSAIFYNPAGISKINKDAGFEINLLKLSVGFGKNSIKFVKDLQNAFDTGDLNNNGKTSDDQLRAVNKVIKKYQGENLHIEVNDYSSISRKWSKIGFTIGFLLNANSNSITHQGFGTEGVLEEHMNIIYGPTLGLSYDALDGKLNLGVSGKFLHKKSVNHYFTPREIVEHENNMDNYITKTLAKDGSAFGADLGVIYNIDKFPLVPISVGASLLNIGDLNFGKAGKIPMTANIGVALKPQLPIFDWTIALDYVDLTNNYKQDKDKLKRVRAGAEIGLLDRWWGGLKVRGGIYQGYLTAGAELRLLLLTAMFTTYEEEVGAYAGQKGDRRYLLTLSIGW